MSVCYEDVYCNWYNTCSIIEQYNENSLQQSSLITPPVYETINQDNTDVYDNIK